MSGELTDVADELRSIAMQLEDMDGDDVTECDETYAHRLLCLAATANPRKLTDELIVEMLRRVGLEETANTYENLWR